MPKPSNPPKPSKSPKYPNPYKKYTIRIYANDSAYNAELIDEFPFKANDIRGFGGMVVRDPSQELEELFLQIGKNGHSVETESGGKIYYPPHRIHYIEAELADKSED